MCGSALLSSLFTLRNAACVCSSDHDSSLQALPAASRHIRSYPPFSKILPTYHSLPLLYQTYSCLLSLCEGSATSCQENCLLGFKGHHHHCMFLGETGSCLPLGCPLTQTGRSRTIILLFPPSQIFHFQGSLSNSWDPQIQVPEEDYLFCFPVAVPTSTAAVMADAPVMEKQCFSLYFCVSACLLTFAQVCALGRVCVHAHKSKECR